MTAFGLEGDQHGSGHARLSSPRHLRRRARRIPPSILVGFAHRRARPVGSRTAQRGQPDPRIGSPDVHRLGAAAHHAVQRGLHLSARRPPSVHPRCAAAGGLARPVAGHEAAGRARAGRPLDLWRRLAAHDPARRPALPRLVHAGVFAGARRRRRGARLPERDQRNDPARAARTPPRRAAAGGRQPAPPAPPVRYRRVRLRPARQASRARPCLLRRGRRHRQRLRSRARLGARRQRGAGRPALAHPRFRPGRAGAAAHRRAAGDPRHHHRPARARSAASVTRRPARARSWRCRSCAVASCRRPWSAIRRRARAGTRNNASWPPTSPSAAGKRWTGWPPSRPCATPSRARPRCWT